MNSAAGNNYRCISQYVLCIVVLSGVDTAPAKFRGAGRGWDQTYRILKFIVGSIEKGFHSSDRRQYSGSLLGDMVVTLLLIITSTSY